MMNNEKLHSAEMFCTSHNIEISFISSLQQAGLIEITTINNAPFITSKQIVTLEKIVRFHYELDINVEGIESILQLLMRIESMQNEIVLLKNELRMY
jgi:chaperone modulatory protein CbpM